MENYLTRWDKKIRSNQKLVEVIILLIIFAVSMMIRRIGIKHGFPILTHPDEITIIQPVLDMTRLHSLNPGIFSRPDQILDYLNLIFLNIVSFLKYGQNVYWAFEEHYLVFYFYSRLLISIMGSLIPIVAYKIGKEIKPKLALPATIVFATFPLYVEHSLYITPDIPITLFTLLIIYFAIKYLNTQKNIYLILATAFTAINTAEKYPGILSLALVILALGLQIFCNDKTTQPKKFKRFLLKSLLIAIVFIVSLFVVAPFLFIEYKSVIQALVTESRSTHLGADNLGWLGNMWFYVKTFFANINIIGALLFGVGLFALVKTWNKKYILVFYGFFYWITLSKLALHWERWALPMFIAPLLIIAIGISFFWEKSKQRQSTKFIGALLIGIFIFQQSAHALYIPIRLKYTETRLASKIFCETNGIIQENSIYEGYTPLGPAIAKEVFSDYLMRTPDKDYILLSSSMYGRYFAEPDRYQDYIRIYDEIRENNTLIKRYQPYPIAKNTMGQLENILYFVQYRFGRISEIRYSGPIIEIYQIPE